MNAVFIPLEPGNQPARPQALLGTPLALPQGSQLAPTVTLTGNLPQVPQPVSIPVTPLHLQAYPQGIRELNSPLSD